MAAPVLRNGHVSNELGHTSAPLRAVVGTGLASVAFGFMLLMWIVIGGLNAARSGTVSSDTIGWQLIASSGAIVFGLLVAFLGMAAARHHAGE